MCISNPFLDPDSNVRVPSGSAQVYDILILENTVVIKQTRAESGIQLWFPGSIKQAYNKICTNPFSSDKFKEL